MKECWKILIVILISVNAMAQNTSDSFRNRLQENFDFNSLHDVPCKDLPVGLYTVLFNVNNKGIPENFKFSADSLQFLKYAIIKAIKRSCESGCLPPSQPKQYLQLVYVNTSAWCKQEIDTNITLQNINTTAIKLLSGQIFQIEKSFQDVIKAPGDFLVLETVSLTDANSPIPKGTPVDLHPRHSLKSPEEIRKIEEKVRAMNKDEVD